MMSGSEDNRPVSVCNHCQFILHCGCCYDDHDYKLDTCDYYSLAHRYNLMSAQFDKMMARLMKIEGDKL